VALMCLMIVRLICLSLRCLMCCVLISEHMFDVSDDIVSNDCV